MGYECRPLSISGAYELSVPRFQDARGVLQKIYHAESFREWIPEMEIGETLVSRNKTAGVVRGFHFQRPPYAQAKTLFCLEGALVNVVLDIRRGSPTYGEVESVCLSGEKGSVLYIPEGIANCYAIREDNTVVIYNLTSKYMPDYADGIRWDSVGVDFGADGGWILSEKDASLPRWEDFTSPF